MKFRFRDPIFMIMHQEVSLFNEEGIEIGRILSSIRAKDGTEFIAEIYEV